MACAEPFNATFEQPVIWLPSAEKPTCPAGMPPPGVTALTEAVKVTGLPYPDGFRFDDSNGAPSRTGRRIAPARSTSRSR